MRTVATTYICTEYHSSLLCFSSSCPSSVFPLLLFLNRLRFWKCVWYFCILMYTNTDKNQLMNNNNWLSHQKSFNQTRISLLLIWSWTHGPIKPYCSKFFTGFVPFFEQKIQWLFKDFQWHISQKEKKKEESPIWLTLQQHFFGGGGGGGGGGQFLLIFPFCLNTHSST